MKVIRLRGSGRSYTGNAYLVLGDWNRLEDINTLVDTGTDGSIISEIDAINTGVGKRPVERVVLTHSHFDHAGGLKALLARWNPEIWAFNHANFNARALRNGQALKIADRLFEVIHTPGHSNDSVCLHGPDEKVLFSGDTPLRVMTPGGSYSSEFIVSLEKIARRKIEIVYPGHDDAYTVGVREMILTTLKNVRQSHITENSEKEV